MAPPRKLALALAAVLLLCGACPAGGSAQEGGEEECVAALQTKATRAQDEPDLATDEGVAPAGDVDTVPPHLPLCDARVVEETCALLLGPDATGEAVAPGDVQETLAARASAVDSLWQGLGLDAGASVKCADLCQRVVAKLGETTTLPPTSDVGCYTTVGGRAVCDVDLDPARVTEVTRFSGDLPDFNDGGKTPALPAPRGMEIANRETLEEARSLGIAYSDEAILHRVANLFRIYPAGQVSTLPIAQDRSVSVNETESTNKHIQCVSLEARKTVEMALRLLRRRRREDVMRTWFGDASSSTPETRKEILRVINSMEAVVSNAQIVYPGPDCNANTYGYVYPHGVVCDVGEVSLHGCTTNTQGQFIIYYCPFALTQPRPEQVETVTHEASHHAIAYTQDFFYGQDLCKAKAKEGAAEVLRNADTFGYYIQGLTNSSKTKK